MDIAKHPVNFLLDTCIYRFNHLFRVREFGENLIINTRAFNHFCIL